jgi:hypothetical protein
LEQREFFAHRQLNTPKAAAIAGLLFSLLFAVIIWLFRKSVPPDPLESGEWLVSNVGSAALAVNLIPFCGVAFLWFLGVLRDRLGDLEDRFFSTVFFGSGLLFVAMLFVAAALIGAIILVASTAEPRNPINLTAFKFFRAMSFIVINVYATKMAGVFMISMSTVIMYTGIVPRWIAYVGYGLALVLVIGSYYETWVITVLPAWVLLVSLAILKGDGTSNKTPRFRS